MEIKGKVVLVTGGAVRIGRAISEALANKGARLAIHYHASGMEAKKLSCLGEIFQADLSQIQEVKRLVQEVETKLGPIQILINNAAIFEKASFLELTEENWNKHLDINLKAPFLLAQAVSRSMLDRKAGKIINIADDAAQKPYRNYLPHCVAKAGLIGLTKALAKELAPHVQVNAVAPGPILTDLYSEEQKERAAQWTLIKRCGVPQDVANAVLFLIEGADFVTGSVVTVNGGRLLA